MSRIEDTILPESIERALDEAIARENSEPVWLVAGFTSQVEMDRQDAADYEAGIFFRDSTERRRDADNRRDWRLIGCES